MLEAGGSDADWAATVARMRERYGADLVTGLRDEQAAAIAEYLTAVRPLEGGYRPLRVVVARSGAAALPDRPAAPESPGLPGSRRPAAAGPAEPVPGRRGDGSQAAAPGAGLRLPAGPDPALAEGRPPKPLESLASRFREAVEGGAARWKAEGCAGCHPSDAEVRAWAPAFPQVPLFRPDEGVVTLARAVEHWRRRPGASVEDPPGLGPEETALVAYLTWRADGAPMAAGRAYPLPPAVDLERLAEAVERGRANAEGEPGRLDGGACGRCHPQGGGTDRNERGERVPAIRATAALFPRFAPELGRVGTLEDYLTAHLALAYGGEPAAPPALGRPGSREMTDLLAYLAWLARDRLLDVGRPPGARARASAELGREIYQLRCGICHDPQRREPGPLGPGLAGLLGRGRLPSGRPATREEVIRTIRSGTPGMPAFSDLTSEQLEDLLAYLRTL